MPFLPYQRAIALMGRQIDGGVGLVRSALMPASFEARVRSMAIIFQLRAMMREAEAEAAKN
jgi:hypothetical protein